MSLPPAALVRSALLETVLPPFAVAAVVFALLVLPLGRRMAPLAAALALAAGWAVTNHFHEVVPWLPNTNRIGWLPVVALMATVAGLFARRSSAGWAVWAAVLTFAVPRLLPAEYLKQPWWAVPGFVLLTAAAGFAPARAARQSSAPAFLVAAALFAAGTVAVHAHSARLMDAAVVAGAAVFGLAVIGLVLRADVGAALPGAAVLLVGVSLLAHYETADSHAIPAATFALPAAAPLPLLLGRRGRVVQYALGLLLAAAGVGLAAWHEPLDFENL